MALISGLYDAAGGLINRHYDPPRAYISGLYDAAGGLISEL